MPTSDIGLVGSDAANVIRILAHYVLAQIRQRLPHFTGVLLVHTEHNGLCKRVSLLQKASQMLSDGICSCSKRNHPLEVLRLIFVVWNLATIAVQFCLARTPSGCVPVRDDAMDAVGC